MKQRDTRQLAAVYDVVQAAHDHPTADQVHARVRGTLPRVSLGTVYRNLQKLVAQQRVRRVDLPPHPARFDAMLAEHDHFVCDQCGAVTDLLRRRPLPRLHRRLGRTGYAVRAQELTVYGICPACSTRHH